MLILILLGIMYCEHGRPYKIRKFRVDNQVSCVVGCSGWQYTRQHANKEECDKHNKHRTNIIIIIIIIIITGQHT